MEEDTESKVTFSKKGVWLGLIAYIVLILIVAIIFLFG